MEIYLYQKASLVGCIDLKGFFCCGYDSCVTHVRRYFYLIGRKTMHHPKIKYCHWIDSPYTLNQGKFLCTDLFPFLWVSILIFLAVLWISRKKSMRLNCDVLCLWFSHMCSVQSVVSSLDSCEKDLSSSLSTTVFVVCTTQIYSLMMCML